MSHTFRCTRFITFLLLIIKLHAWILSFHQRGTISRSLMCGNQPSSTTLSLQPPRDWPLEGLETKENLISSEHNDETYSLRFQGIGRLYSSQSRKRTDNDDPNATPFVSTDLVLQRLNSATVAVVGLGGVGSWAAEALCRSGVGNLVLIDLDDICISNMNRQLHALSSTVGSLKIETMKRRLLDINPGCNITLIPDFVNEENVRDLLRNRQVTLLLDAIDGGKEKSALLSACADFKIPVITCGGAAGRTDPMKILCDDLTRAKGDKLLATCRKTLRKEYGFERGDPYRRHQVDATTRRRKWNILCVYSTEEQGQIDQEHDVSSLRRCDGILGTACFVTGTFGFVAAARATEMIAYGKLKAPVR